MLVVVMNLEEKEKARGRSLEIKETRRRKPNIKQSIDFIYFGVNINNHQLEFNEITTKYYKGSDLPSACFLIS